MKDSMSKLLLNSVVVLMLILLQTAPRQLVSAASEIDPGQPAGDAPLVNGTISGHVYQSDGSTGIVGAAITVYRQDFSVAASPVYSKSQGLFTTITLPDGFYYLGVQAAGWGGVYFPNAYDNPHAQLIQVKTGQNTSGTNFSLSPEATLSGAVVQQSYYATPIPGAQVLVTPLYGGLTHPVTSAADGSFSMGGLASGYYIASASKDGFEQEFFNNALSADTAEPIQLVQQQNKSNINFTLAPPSTASPGDTDKLNHFYNDNGGVAWSNHSGWGSADNACTTWYGVVCHDGHVAGLNLDNNNVSGSLSPYLYQLSTLQLLSLQNNQITGLLSNTQISNLTDLRILNLSHNQIGGEIPVNISALSSLNTLQLNNNLFSGLIPYNIGFMTELRTLLLNDNQLSGPIPHEFGYIGALRVLNLSDNLLTSLSTSLGALNYLTDLDLHHNQITSAIPTDLGNIVSLVHLYLQSNQFTGSIPDIFSNLTDLKEINLGSNQLTGSIPISLAACTRLEKIQLDHNQLTGTIPAGFGALRSLQRLDLYFNNLTGPIPTPQSGGFANLAKLDLSYNQLTGSIPSALGSATNLNWLDLGSNQLSGSIPTTLGNLTNLQLLFIDNNHLTGSIPPGLGNPNLNDLYLDSNNLSGSIPDSLGTLSPYLQNLYLENNQLTGSIPDSLGTLSHLTYLGLSHNLLSGPIPDVTSLTSLTILRIDHNHLNGDIPASLASLNLYGRKGAWDGGDGLDLDYNRLTVPASPAQLAAYLADKDPGWDLSQSSIFPMPLTGGTFNSRDNRAEFVLPDGTLSAPTNFVLTLLAAPQHDYPVFTFAHTAFTLNTEDDLGQPMLVTLLQPIHITLGYTDADAAGLDESRLELYYWDTTHSKWTDAATTCPGSPGYTRNPAANTLSLNVCHFTEYALMAAQNVTYLPMVKR